MYQEKVEFYSSVYSDRLTIGICVIVLALSFYTALPATAAAGLFIAHNTPGFVATAKNLGTEDPSKRIEVSIWLNPHNRGDMDALAQDLYNPRSPNSRHWLKRSEIAARFAPTAAEARIVEDFFEMNNLQVVKVAPDNFYVRASGTVADVEKAFHVQLNNYQVGNQTLRANAGDPYIEGPVAVLVQAVSGLDNGAFQHSAQTILAPASGTRSDGTDLTRAMSAGDSSAFQTVCFPGTKTENYTTQGSYPKATYIGNAYSYGQSGCGYSPANLYAAYNLNGLYAEGHDGAGQTIVIIDWCGSPTLLDDANAFADKFGLPKLTASNFNVITYPGSTSCSGMWPIINLDVEWTHAIAPGANLDLLLPASPSYQDTDEAIYDAINYGWGNVVSGSFYTAEFFVGEAEADKENLISEIAAIEGIATNFASGDSGQVAGHIAPIVNVPADLPYATGVGGVSLALNADNSIAFQTGWESYESFLTFTGQIKDPPLGEQFQGGSGGGASTFFTKPGFQKSVPGKYRQVPDIAWLADPWTGAVIVVSEPAQFPPQVWYVAGGTELATDMFSGLWAIANQEAGGALGQAAPYLYSMPSRTITDVVPYSPGSNVTAVIYESSAVTHSYNPAATLGVLEPQFGVFYSAMFDTPWEQNTTFAIGFGEDYNLKTKVGWDDVTGVGTPNAKAFADWFAPAAASKK